MVTAEHQTKYRALLTMGFWAQDTHCDPQGRGHKQREGLHSGLAHCQPPSLLIPCKPWPGTQRLLTSALSPGAPFAAQPVMLPPIQGTQPPTPPPPGQHPSPPLPASLQRSQGVTASSEASFTRAPPPHPQKAPAVRPGLTLLSPLPPCVHALAHLLGRALSPGATRPVTG